MKPKLIVIEGTNASGKSDLAVQVAGRFRGEIVSADSRQIYRGMDLGSGKITPEEQKGVPHHLLDVREPGVLAVSPDGDSLVMYGNGYSAYLVLASDVESMVREAENMLTQE